ncbi:MAG TPA: hypothetical protein VMG74_05045 [Gaiellaceae bacterium]|nr:hypothetical protein [Gaiellaceae bacterium]
MRTTWLALVSVAFLLLAAPASAGTRGGLTLHVAGTVGQARGAVVPVAATGETEGLLDQ